MINGAEGLLKVLEEENVEYIFGYPGGSVIPIYDKLYSSKIKNILPRHEQGGAHAADGYARSTGRVGVCMATSGPGAMNLCTGLANAYMDSIPIVAITGQVKRNLIGKDSFQEADTTGVTIPITKHNYLVTNPDELVDITREAFYLAQSGRPGPILIDVPFDVSLGDVRWTERDIKRLDAWEEPRPVDPRLIKRAAEMIEQAQRPVIMIGGGVIAAEASDQLRRFVDRVNIPVIHTLMAKGAFPETHELSMGMPGMHGMAYASLALDECDLMIVIGARFDDRITGDPSTFARGASVIHIDIDAAELDKVRPTNVGINADAAEALEMLTPACKSRGRGAWEDHLIDYRTYCGINRFFERALGQTCRAAGNDQNFL